jgi:hypothetical protein
VDACGHIDSFMTRRCRSLHSWCRDLCDVRVQLDSCVRAIFRANHLAPTALCRLNNVSNGSLNTVIILRTSRLRLWLATVNDFELTRP